MAAASQFGAVEGNAIPFPRRSRSEIEPALKSFLDEVVVPLLVTDALAELEREKVIESKRRAMEHSDKAAERIQGEGSR